MNEYRFPIGVTPTVRAQLCMIGDGDEIWEWNNYDSIPNSLKNIYLISSSGIIYSVLSERVIALAKGSKHKLELIDKSS